VSKFSDYLFKEGADHGKDAVFRSYGYGADDSQVLANEYEQQAAAKYASGDYTLGKADQYGQRININITLNGQGAAAGRSTQVVSGWMIRGDGSITLNTPFSGFGQ
jgi:filamentous hemagglutinin